MFDKGMVNTFKKYIKSSQLKAVKIEEIQYYFK